MPASAMPQHHEWTEVHLRTKSAHAPTLSEALIREGASGTWLQDDAGGTTIVAFFPSRTDVCSRLASVEAALPGLTPFPEPAVSGALARDWEQVWREQFHPFRVGERWAVQAPWHERPAGIEIIEIEPGMAFGTGLHHTTRLCLEALLESEVAGSTVVDVGAGSGVLAVAAAKAGAARVLALDYDLEALLSAAGNVARNGVTERVHLFAASGVAAIRRAAAGRPAWADIVVANLTPTGVSELAGHLPGVLRPGGRFLASGIAEPSARGVECRLLEQGFNITRRRQAEDWIAFEALLCR